jgi:hypothetical protein
MPETPVGDSRTHCVVVDGVSVMLDLTFISYGKNGRKKLFKLVLYVLSDI